MYVCVGGVVQCSVPTERVRYIKHLTHFHFCCDATGSDEGSGEASELKC